MKQSRKQSPPCSATPLLQAHADLNQSFAAVGERINKIPLVASLSPDGPLPRIVPFIGSGEDPMQFSMWLRRLEDVMRMRSTSWSSQQKACFLIGYLDGVAREKVKELPDEERNSLEAIVANLKKYFEGPQHRYMARQALSSCQQHTGESSATFANRLLTLVEQLLLVKIPLARRSGFSRSSSRASVQISGIYVKLDNPSSFEQAVTKAQMVEQLLAEATANRLICPSTPPKAIEVKVGNREGIALGKVSTRKIRSRGKGDISAQIPLSGSIQIVRFRNPATKDFSDLRVLTHLNRASTVVAWDTSPNNVLRLGLNTANAGRLPQSTDLFGCAYSYFQSAASRTPAAPAPLPRTSAEAIELPRLAIDATTSWPPRAIMAPVNVLALTDSDRLFVAQIPIRVNNIHVLALVDTGASITTAKSSLQEAIPVAQRDYGLPLLPKTLSNAKTDDSL
ncbi:hypothetical protein OSTOST_15813, partial [Ostertagia ostertagi]